MQKGSHHGSIESKLMPKGALQRRFPGGPRIVEESEARSQEVARGHKRLGRTSHPAVSPPLPMTVSLGLRAGRILSPFLPADALDRVRGPRPLTPQSCIELAPPETAGPPIHSGTG